MKILITGGHGFIGHYVTRNFLTSGDDITVLDGRKTYGTLDRDYLDGLVKERIAYISFDYEDICDDVRGATIDPDFDTIIHLAQTPRQYEVSLNPQEASDVLFGGLMNLLKQSKNLKHFIFISTSMVYGDFEDNVKENAPLCPKSQYGVLRMGGESFIKAYCEANGIKYTIIRPSAVYGPRDTNNRVVGRIFQMAKKNEFITVHGQNVILDFTFVTDIAKGIYSCVGNERSYNQIFNMTRSFQGKYTIYQLASRIIHITGSKSYIDIDNPDPAYPIRSVLSIDKARHILGFCPNIDLDEGLYQTHEWLKHRAIEEFSEKLNA